jgi:hypothetical protein
MQSLHVLQRAPTPMGQLSRFAEQQSLGSADFTSLIKVTEGWVEVDVLSRTAAEKDQRTANVPIKNAHMATNSPYCPIINLRQTNLAVFLVDDHAMLHCSDGMMALICLNNRTRTDQRSGP